MKVDWIEWIGRGLQLVIVALVVAGVYQWSAEASRKQETLCELAQLHVESLDASAMAAAAGVSVERYNKAEYVVAVSGSEVQVDKWNALWSVWYDRIPTEVRQEIKHAEKVVSEACDRNDYYAGD